MRGIDDLEAGDVETVLACGLPDLSLGSDQDRPDDAGVRAVDCAAQRCFVAGMHDNGRDRGHGLGRRDQAVILAGRLGLPGIGRHNVAPIPSNLAYDAFAFGSKGATFDALFDPSVASTPNKSATRCKRLAGSLAISPLAASTSRMAAKAARR